jgi:hypothetical protein
LAILSQFSLHGVLNYGSVQALNPFSGKKIRAVDNPGIVLGFLNLQRFNPHFVTVVGNAFFDYRFDLFPDGFHRAKFSKSLSCLQDKA